MLPPPRQSVPEPVEAASGDTDGRELSRFGHAPSWAKLRHPEAKYPYRQPLGRGPEGRKFCRWCWREVGPRRSTFCSDACVDEFKIENDWGWVKRQVDRRDRGVCAICGCDTLKLLRILQWACRWEQRLSLYGPSGLNRCSFRLEVFGTRRGGMGFHEIDHIRQRAEGGTNEMTNLRTLCVGCHADETRMFASRRAEARRASKANLFTPPPGDGGKGCP